MLIIIIVLQLYNLNSRYDIFCRIVIKFRSRQLCVRRSGTAKMARHPTSSRESAVRGVATWSLFGSKLAPITPSLLLFLSEMKLLPRQKALFLSPSQTLGGSGHHGRNVAAVVGVVDRAAWESVNWRGKPSSTAQGTGLKFASATATSAQVSAINKSVL